MIPIVRFALHKWIKTLKIFKVVVHAKNTSILSVYKPGKSKIQHVLYAEADSLM